MQTLEKDKLELLADANSSRARASALEEKYSAARVRCEGEKGICTDTRDPRMGEG